MCVELPYHRFTVGGSEVIGFKVADDGAVSDFRGTLRNHYKSLAHASAAARRKYRDSTITITECVPRKTRYKVDFDKLMAIAELDQD